MAETAITAAPTDDARPSSAGSPAAHLAAAFAAAELPGRGPSRCGSCRS